MLKRVLIIFSLNVILSDGLFSQDGESLADYHNIMINNPALSGSEGDGTLRLSYLNFYPGNNYNLHSVYFSYDSYVPALHGGIGISISDDYLGGIVNDFRGAASYAYFLQAGKDFFLNAGLSASVYHRGFNFEGAVLPDQIDPLGGAIYPSAETLANSGRSVFDLGAGFVFIAGNFFGGISVNHLAEPDLSESIDYEDKLKRKLLVHLAGDINLNKSKNLKIRPVGYLYVQEGFVSGGAGMVFQSNYLSINTLLLSDNEKNMNIQSGFAITTGKVNIFYNYRFNVLSENNMMPLSLLHQTGLAFSLNNVDKRKTIKTINFPKL
jgi:type IX secretion system PorP/SprF family membrane protein